MERYNYLRDGVANIKGKAFTPAHVCNGPKIFTSCAVRGGKEKAKRKEKAQMHRRQKRGMRRGNYLSRTYGRRGQTVFTTYVS